MIEPYEIANVQLFLTLKNGNFIWFNLIILAHFISLFDGIPLCDYTTIHLTYWWIFRLYTLLSFIYFHYLFIYLLQTMAFWKFSSMFSGTCERVSPGAQAPEMELLDHIVCTYLAFIGIAKLFARVIVSIYISPSRIIDFPLLQTLTHTLYWQVFKYCQYDGC